jgi:MFS family permease
MSRTSIEMGTLPTASSSRKDSFRLEAVDGQFLAPSTENVNAINASTDNVLETVSEEPVIESSRMKASIIIVTVASMQGLNSTLNGILTVALPSIASDLHLGDDLLLWPAAVFALVSGCTLLLSGSVSDVLGARIMYMTGCVLLAAFTLANGLARTGIELIIFRAFSGLAISFCLPSAVSIITKSFAVGQRRNVAFSCVGAAQPLGFSLGLVLGGLLADSVGWRVAYYFVPALLLAIIVLSYFNLPKDIRESQAIMRRRLVDEIDWVGAVIASSGLGMLSYVFATVTSSASRLRDPVNIALLVVAIASFPAFVFWVSRQEKNNKPAIIPNSLWKNLVFTSICISVFISWGVFATTQYFVTLFFQRVQGLNPLQASVRFLPMVITGAATNVATGYLVTKVPANILLLGSMALTALSPLLMALATPETSYWFQPFWAVFLAPISADTLFTCANLVITSVFPAKTQGLAGGVFSTLSQVGNSVGLAVAAMISSSVAASTMYEDKGSPLALEQGYKAAFWMCFALQVVLLPVAGLGMRKIGKVGLKRD